MAEVDLLDAPFHHRELRARVVDERLLSRRYRPRRVFWGLVAYVDFSGPYVNWTLHFRSFSRRQRPDSGGRGR